MLNPSIDLVISFLNFDTSNGFAMIFLWLIEQE